MKQLKVIFLLMLFTNVMAADNFIAGKGRFIADPDDSYEFVTKQLTYEGFKDIISKKLNKLGLNEGLFWQKIEADLTEKYKLIDEKLRLKYKMDESPSSYQKRNYKKYLRLKKLTLRKNYANINRVITRYAVNKIYRSQKNPNYRYIRLEGEVNPLLLNKLYYKFIKGKNRSEYGSIFLDVDFVLDGVTYSELNIENEKDFEGVVTKSWLEWFVTNKPANISTIEILDDDKRSRLMEYLKIPSENMMDNVPEFGVNSLLLKIQVKITKTKYDESLNRYDFKYDGSAFLKDLQTNLNINTYELSVENKSYMVTEGINLANILANHVYKVALGSFPKMISSIKSLAPISNIQRLSVYNYKNMDNVDYLIKQIKQSGIKYALKADLENVSTNKADLVLYFDGNLTDIKGMLFDINSAKNDLSFEVIDTTSTLGIKFKKELPAEKI